MNTLIVKTSGGKNTKNDEILENLEFCTEALPCEAVIVLDANALYLNSLMNTIPTGYHSTRRRIKDGLS